MKKTYQTIATISTKNNESSIYACLKSAIEQFDVIFVIDENSSDETCREINKFVRRQKTKNVFVYDMSNFVVWPTLPDDENINLSRRISKEFNLASRFSAAIWVSIRPNIVLHEQARHIIETDMSIIKTPELSHNFYKSSKENRCISSVLLPSNLLPGPESGSKTSPSFYVKEDGIIKKIIFNEKNYSNMSIGVEI